MRTPEPHEARHPAWDPTKDEQLALMDVATAVNGFAYAGDRLDTLIATVAWLRENPDHACALGLG